MQIRALAILAVFCGGTAAQTPVGTLPAGYETQEGGTAVAPGFHYAPARLLALYPPADLPGTLKTLRGLLLRPDGRVVAGMAAKKLTLELALAHRGVRTQAPYALQWSRYLGTDRTVVVKSRSLALPQLPPARGPRPWSTAVKIPFDAPWVRSGSSSDGLAVDFKLRAAAPASASWEADGVTLGHFGAVEPRGAGCPNGFLMFVRGTYAGAQLYAYGYARTAGLPVLMFLGRKSWNLPLPGTGCRLLAAPEFVHPSVLTSRGSQGFAYRFVWGFVPGAAAGAAFYTQLAAVQPGLGILTSQAERVTIGPGPGGTLQRGSLYGYGRSFDPDKSPPTAAVFTVPVLGWY